MRHVKITRKLLKSFELYMIHFFFFLEVVCFSGGLFNVLNKINTACTAAGFEFNTRQTPRN